MKAWLCSVFALSLFTVLLSLLLKKTRLQKTIQAVLSVLLSLTFVQPIVRLKGEENFIFSEWKEETLPVSGEMQNLLIETKKSYLEEKISQKLRENGVDAEVQVYGSFEEKIKIEKVLLKLQLSSISLQKMNIVEIRRMVSAYCEVKEEDITVYAR